MVSFSTVADKVPALLVSVSGGFIGAGVGIGWRMVNGIEQSFKVVREVVPQNACAAGPWLLPEVNSVMHGLASHIPLKLALPGVFSLMALAFGDKNGPEYKKAFGMGLVASILPVAMGIITDAQKTWAPSLAFTGFTFDASGHFAMMSAVGAALGLADECAKRCGNRRINNMIRTVTWLTGVTFGLGNLVMLTYTAGCRHTVPEMFDGAALFSAVLLVPSAMGWFFSR